MSEVRLQVKNLCKNFGITKAVQNVSFNVNKGEVHALIGENGSGKSTLTNMLTGIYSIGSGTFILDGKEIHPKNQVEANNEGVSIIVQELGTLSGLTVAENIFLGHEDQFVHFGIKNTNAMNKKATELLKKYGFDRIKAADMIDNYNFEDRKLVEIVKATYFDPKVVVIDETTTALSQEGREELYKHMERIKKSGNTVIFISHDLPEILDKSDTITILRDGVYIDTVKSKDVTEDDLKKLMVGREVTGDYYRSDYGEKVSDEVVLSVKNVTVPGLIEDISFDFVFYVILFRILKTELSNESLVRYASLVEVTLGGLVDLLGAHFAVAHLNSLVAVRLNGLLLHDGAGAGLDDGDRNDLAVGVEQLGHAQLLADDTFLHCVCPPVKVIGWWFPINMTSPLICLAARSVLFSCFSLLPAVHGSRPCVPALI